MKKEITIGGRFSSLKRTEDGEKMNKWNKNYNFKNNKINIGIIEIMSGLAALCILAMFTIMITTVILGILGKIGILLTDYIVIISLITVFFSLVFILNKYLLK